MQLNKASVGDNEKISSLTALFVSQIKVEWKKKTKPPVQ